VTILEQANRVGGRIGTRHFELPGRQPATFDHGAQYFTVREDRFQGWVDRWLAADVVTQWSTGFATPEASAYRDGHPRYRGSESMVAIPRHLARGLDIHLSTTVAAVHYDEGWQVTTAAGRQYKAPALILTPPVPQSLALLTPGKVLLPPEERQILARIEYDPCFAVMALLDGPSAIPAPGGLWPAGEMISWMADNRQKGISAVPAITIHGNPAFSRAHFERDQDDVANLLLTEAAPWLGSTVVAHQVRRWRYSIPVQLFPGRCLSLTDPGPLVFAGDAFSGPRIEGAALSGLAAADALLAPQSR
jgi:predicted NAD/FAD-dependent oxidoreductase